VIRSVVLSAVLLTGSPVAQAAEVEGVGFPASRTVMGATLQLHEAAVLRYLVFEVWAAGLYLGEGVEPDRLLDDVPRRLEIEYFYGFTADQLADATVDAITRNVGAERAKAMSGPIARLNALYRDVRAGDRYAISYVPGAGTQLELNGESLGVVPGAEFSRALFSIWFGEVPLSADLKRDLVGNVP
jgi:hypothetical protein